MRGLLKLTWLEIKIFVREPLGFVGAVGMPVVVFLVLGGLVGGISRPAAVQSARQMTVDAPIFAAILILLTSVLSLVTIIAIYREGGILKRLRATPLRPQTIFGAQVLVKLLFAAISFALMILAGRRYYADIHELPIVAFTVALLISSASILSMGFLISSLVPTARFAQPIGAVILYPMVGLSGLFVPIDLMPQPLYVIARFIPLTYAVSLMRGIWVGESWFAHLGDIAALGVATVVFSALAARFFRWE